MSVLARISDIRIGERRREDLGDLERVARVKNESDWHHSLKIVLAAKLAEYGAHPLLEYQPFSKQSKHRIDVALPNTKIGIEVYLDKYSQNRHLILERFLMLQENGWVIKWFIPSLHLGSINNFIDRVLDWNDTRSGKEKYTTICADRCGHIIKTYWVGMRILRKEIR